jgi:glucose/mannose-6-phosphate isomerase
MEEMISSVQSLPLHLKQGYDKGCQLTNQINPAMRTSYTLSKIYIGGMGGSAFPAELGRLLTNQAGIPLHLCRGYQFPLPLDEHTLVCLCSFSGNTEETLSLLSQVLQSKAQCVILTSGGQLLEQAHQNKLPHILFNKPFDTFQPRAASGLFLGAFIGLFKLYFPTFNVPLWEETLEDLKVFFKQAPHDHSFKNKVHQYSEALN